MITDGVKDYLANEQQMQKGKTKDGEIYEESARGNRTENNLF